MVFMVAKNARELPRIASGRPGLKSVCEYRGKNRRSLHFSTPIFLSRPMAFMDSMRLSEKKSSLPDRGKDRPLMGLRPVLLNPRTLARTWGTRQESV
jgi:hypothetical protein